MLLNRILKTHSGLKIQWNSCRRSNVTRASSFAVKIVKLADQPNLRSVTLLTSSF